MEDIGIPYPEPKKPEYKEWSVLDFWSLSESAHLLNGVEPGCYKPNSLNYVGALKCFEDPCATNVHKIQSAIERAVEVGIFEKDIDHIYPKPLIQWAMGKGFSVPDELKEMLHSDSGDSDKGVYASYYVPNSGK